MVAARVIGLTGGIGAGKSEVARLFADRGAIVVDADQIARLVVEPGTPGLQAVVDAFGTGVLRPDGSLDRPALAAIVFADPAARRRLEAITHPLIRAETQRRVAAAPAGSVVVHDVPLLVEAGLAAAYDAVVVVEAPEAVRVRRLVTLRGMPEDAARARVRAQASEDDRRRVATAVIENTGDLAELARQVDEVWRELDLPPAPTSAS